jgi:CheY-like chemotaxis protein
MKTILIVDDDPGVRAYLKAVLETTSHELMIASNGEEAIQTLNSYQCDLLITDIFMPVAEGLNTIVRVRQNYPEMKIIAISGGGLLGIGNYLDHARIYGADAALEKPIQSTDLIEQVDQLLNMEYSLASNFCV